MNSCVTSAEHMSLQPSVAAMRFVLELQARSDGWSETTIMRLATA